ncbi:MAG: membrane dipeptidase, partial [Arenibacter sp.]
MKHFIGFICLLSIMACKEKEEKLAESVEENAVRIHKEVITIDTHVDINVTNFTDTINYTQKLANQVNLPKLKSGGLDVPWLIVYTGQGEVTEVGSATAKETAMAKFDAIHRLCEKIAPEEIDRAYSSKDVRQIVGSGKKVAMIGVENAYPIGEDLSEFENYYNLGARYISLSHNGHSQFCDSNTGEADGVWLH